MSWNQRNRDRRGERRHGEATGGPRPSRPSALAEQHGIEPFALFCAYHLGITAEGSYRFQNIHHVAKRFGTNAGVIKQLLADLGMDSDTIIHTNFDMASAQVDIMLAPEGINRTELGREFYEQFRVAPRRARNWAKELEDDARANERIFGPGRR
jgi:hypothetical protein